MTSDKDQTNSPEADPCEVLAPVPLSERSIVLVGLMGAGKTTIGRRLAKRLNLAFLDADAEIELAAGETIPEIFERHGEAAFRAGERRVIARLLASPAHVLATGGGAFMDPVTRANITARGISIWLKADLDTLVRRVAKRGDRPLLQNGDVRSTMQRLMDVRYPVYAEADLTVESLEGPHEAIVEAIIEQLQAFHDEMADKESASDNSDQVSR